MNKSFREFMKLEMRFIIALLFLLGCDNDIKEMYYDGNAILHINPHCKNAIKPIRRESLTGICRGGYIGEPILCPLCIDYEKAKMLICEYERYQEYLMLTEDRVILEDVNGAVKYVPVCQYGGNYHSYYVYLAVGRALYLLPYDKLHVFKKFSKSKWVFPPYVTKENLDSVVDSYEDCTYLDHIYNLFIKKGVPEDELGGSFYKFKEKLKKPNKRKEFHEWAYSKDVVLLPFPDFEKAVIECLK